MDYNEIESLVELGKANDKNAREELMVQFTPLILNLSKKSFINSYEFSDNKNECYHTLLKCVRLYNQDKHRFVAYATNSIKNSVNLLIRVSIRRNQRENLKLALENLNLHEKELLSYVFFEKYSLKKYSNLKGIPYALVISMKNDILYKLKKGLNKPPTNNKMN